MATESTREHAVIQRWAEERQARPALVSRTGGLLRFEFNPAAEGELKPIAWDEFFRVFDAKGLELIFDGKPHSRFHKFVYPEVGSSRASGRAPAERSPRAVGRKVATAGSAVAARSQAGGKAGSRTVKPANRAGAEPKPGGRRRAGNGVAGTQANPTSANPSGRRPAADPAQRRTLTKHRPLAAPRSAEPGDRQETKAAAKSAGTKSAGTKSNVAAHRKPPRRPRRAA